MIPKLTQELRQALAEQPGEPLTVEDPITNTRYVLIQVEAYERLQRAVDFDSGEPDPRAFYPVFAEAVKGDLETDGMVSYDTDQSHRPS
jgi:hypothetical protein